MHTCKFSKLEKDFIKLDGQIKTDQGTLLQKDVVLVTVGEPVSNAGLGTNMLQQGMVEHPDRSMPTTLAGHPPAICPDVGWSICWEY